MISALFNSSFNITRVMGCLAANLVCTCRRMAPMEKLSKTAVVAMDVDVPDDVGCGVAVTGGVGDPERELELCFNIIRTAFTVIPMASATRS